MKTALIVDDVASNRARLALDLYKFGFTVEQAANGQQALDKLGDVKIDIIFLDHYMPVMNGFEFLAMFQEIYSGSKKAEIPIIMMSTDLAINMKAVAEKGAWDWVPKPTNLGALTEVLKAYGFVEQNSD